MSQKFVENIDKLIKEIDGRKFLLVRGKSFDFLDIKKDFEQLEHTEFHNFTPNPLYEQVCEGVRLFNKEKCELIVAVGGGSAIDVAKCIKLFCNMNENENYLNQVFSDTFIPLFAVPTTAGTGSESTRHAVIYFDGEKQSISHESIIPNIVLLEPSVLLGLPEYQKKSALLDALCQSIESFWSVNSTEESKRFSQNSIKIIKKYWDQYLWNNSLQVCEKMLIASNDSGRAINITATTAPHAMSYKITSLYGISHGHAVALAMREVWRYMLTTSGNIVDGRGKDYFYTMLNELQTLISFDEFNEMLLQMEMMSPKSKNREAELNILTDSVNETRLKNNPIKIDKVVLYQMYEGILK